MEQSHSNSDFRWFCSMFFFNVTLRHLETSTVSVVSVAFERWKVRSCWCVLPFCLRFFTSACSWWAGPLDVLPGEYYQLVKAACRVWFQDLCLSGCFRLWQVWPLVDHVFCGAILNCVQDMSIKVRKNSIILPLFIHNSLKPISYIHIFIFISYIFMFVNFHIKLMLCFLSQSQDHGVASSPGWLPHLLGRGLHRREQRRDAVPEGTSAHGLGGALGSKQTTRQCDEI